MGSTVGGDPRFVLNNAYLSVEEAGPQVQEAGPLVREAGPLVQEASPLVQEAGPGLHGVNPLFHLCLRKQTFNFYIYVWDTEIIDYFWANLSLTI